MQDEHPATKRRPEEYVLFALTFVGLGTAGGGVILSTPALAVLGVALALFALLAFMGLGLGAD